MVLSPAQAVPFAYVSNERSGTVSVIDLATHKVVSTLKVGSRPRGIHASANRVFVALSDTARNSRSASRPSGLMATPSGSMPTISVAITFPRRVMLAVPASSLAAKQSGAVAAHCELLGIAAGIVAGEDLPARGIEGHLSARPEGRDSLPGSAN